MKNIRIYLDDVRTPHSPNNEWIDGIEEWTVVRSYDEFVEKVKEVGLENIEVITLDHDLGDTAMKEYLRMQWLVSWLAYLLHKGSGNFVVDQ